MVGFLKSILKSESSSNPADQQSSSLVKIRFQLMAPKALNVSLTGDFNSWDEQGMEMKRKINGMWTLSLKLAPGSYQYKFIVDGEWCTDPMNSGTALNEFGTRNSLIEVCPK